VGVTYNTIRSWISVLEASYLCFTLPAWHRNQRKRWVKAPKLHWFDSGLVCHLLGIDDEAHLRTHPLRGAIFESWVAAEIWKAHAHRGVAPNLVHFRETRGPEVDVGIVRGRAVTLVEAKSGATVNDDFFRGLRSIREDLEEGRAFDAIDAAVVYGGDAAQRRADAAVVPWSAIADRDWTRGGRA
jgi:predicted AAA+ superfamily ATPase